jgi:hypothetical protein
MPLMETSCELERLPQHEPHLAAVVRELSWDHVFSRPQQLVGIQK